MLVQKIVSGGQTGVDIGGLRAAKQFGISTGGWMPREYLTLDGPKPEYAAEFGLMEHRSAKYPPRTEANVKMADGTPRFAKRFTTPGEKCTLKYLLKHSKPFLDIDVNTPPPVEEVRTWLKQKQVLVLNVAGNTEAQAPGIEQFVIDYLVKVLREDG